MSLVIKRAPAVNSNERAWAQVYDDINDIIKAVNRKSTDESRTKGSDGEDGNIQSFFEYLKIPYTHSGVLSSMISMNKYLSKKFFEKNKIKTFVQYQFSRS